MKKQARSVLSALFCAAATLSLGACSDSLGNADYSGAPLFTIQGSIESVSELPNDNEQAYASLIWTDIRRLVSAYSDPQLTPVVSSSFPAKFELALFEPARTQAIGAASCPDRVVERIQDEGPDFALDFSNLEDVGFNDWALFHELDFVAMLQRNLKNGADIDDYINQLPLLSELGAVPQSIADYRDIVECWVFASFMRLGRYQTEETDLPKPREACFEAANIIVSNESVRSEGQAAPRIASSLGNISAVSKNHLVLYAPDPERVRQNPEDCFFLIDNPEELERGYNLVAIQCASEDARATFHVIKQTNGAGQASSGGVVLQQGNQEDLLQFAQNCNPDPFAVLRELEVPQTSGKKPPESPTMRDLLSDAVARADQLGNDMQMVLISGEGVDSDGEVSLEPRVGNLWNWTFHFLDNDEERLLGLVYDKESAFTGNPKAVYSLLDLADEVPAVLEESSFPLLPNSDSIVADAGRAGCDVQGFGRINVFRQDSDALFDIDYETEDGNSFWPAFRLPDGMWYRSEVCVSRDSLRFRFLGSTRATSGAPAG